MSEQPPHFVDRYDFQFQIGRLTERPDRPPDFLIGSDDNEDDNARKVRTQHVVAGVSEALCDVPRVRDQLTAWSESTGIAGAAADLIATLDTALPLTDFATRTQLVNALLQASAGKHGRVNGPDAIRSQLVRAWNAFADAQDRCKALRSEAQAFVIKCSLDRPREVTEPEMPAPIAAVVGELLIDMLIKSHLALVADTKVAARSGLGPLDAPTLEPIVIVAPPGSSAAAVKQHLEAATKQVDEQLSSERAIGPDTAQQQRQWGVWWCRRTIGGEGYRTIARSDLHYGATDANVNRQRQNVKYGIKQARDLLELVKPLPDLT